MNLFDIKFKDFLPLLNHQFKDESQMLAKIEEVGKIFNHYRENLHLYRKDTALVAAYCVYYFTTNLPKLDAVLELLPDESLDLNSFDEIIDIGCGPGTFLIALARHMKNEQRLIGIDISKEMLEQAKSICDHYIPEKNLSLAEKYQDQGAKNKLVLFTHSLNEMQIEDALKYIDQIKPDKILFIEPGTKELFEKILSLRDKLIKDFQCVYPCKSNSGCPLDSNSDWCHQYIMVKHSQEVESMTQKLSRNRRLLPLTVHLYSKEKMSVKRSKAFLVRVLKPSKFALNWEACILEGESQKTITLEIMLKPYSKQEKKELHDITAGHEFDFEIVKELGDGRLRAKLIS